MSRRKNICPGLIGQKLYREKRLKHSSEPKKGWIFDAMRRSKDKIQESLDQEFGQR